MDLHGVGTIASGTLQAVSTTLSTLKTARELAKDSKNHELKDVIGEALDSLLDLKERLLALDEENRELRAKPAQKEQFSEPVPPYGYIYKADDTARSYPLCPACFQEKGEQYFVDAIPWGGGFQRRCKKCDWRCIVPYHGAR